MSYWFVCFLFYSFAGYCLEKLFARAIRSPRQVRKCFLLLPLCPVYGLAMTAVLAFVPAGAGFWTLALAGGLICTAVEYLVHLFYDRAFAVWFWDYRPLRGNIKGRVCPQFTLVWGVLSALAVRLVQPYAAALAARLPAWAVFLLWVLLAADCVLTVSLLRRCRDTEMLSAGAVLAQMRAVSQSSTS